MKLPLLAAASILALMPTMAATEQQASIASKNYADVDANKPVICLLPGRVRKVGGMMTYLERRKPREMTSSECEIRGGEYTLYDRANYENALAVWMEGALDGDATSQIYVGEIYEKGWLGEPDYKSAAQWYGKAAEQGDRRAQRRLAYFYENGLGVEADKGQALGLWRSALDLDEDLLLASEVEAERSAAQRRIDGLLGQLEKQNLATGRLQRDLESAKTSLVTQGRELESERRSTASLQAELESVQAAGDPVRVRELEQQLLARQQRLDEQAVAIEILEANVSAQEAQLAASIRQGEVRQKQLARAKEQLEEEATRGDALLRELNGKEQDLTAMEQRLAQTVASLEDSRARQASLQEQVGRQQTSGAAGSADKTALEDALRAARAEVARQETELAQLQQSVAQERSSFKDELASANLREADLSAALASSQAERKALAQQLQAAEAQVAQIEKDLTRSRYALADAQADAATLAERMEALGEDEQEEVKILRAEMEQQQRVVSELRAERDAMQGRWADMVNEQDQMRSELAAEVDQRSWMEIELESAKTKLAAAQTRLRAADQAMEEARWEKEALNQQVQNLEQDLGTSRSRSEADRRRLQAELERTRMKLAQVGTETSQIRREQARLQSDVNMLGAQQETRLLATRSGTAVVANPAGRGRAAAQSASGPSLSSVPASLPRVKPAGNYKAVIIANYEYDYMPDLQTPPRDARELKQMLESRYGFSVEVLINLNRSEMYSVLQQARDFSKKDAVVLYYAGHGKMDEFGDGYWLPTDYRMGAPLSDAVSSGDLTQTLNHSPAKHVLVVADSCYSGAMLRNASPTINKAVPALVKYWMANKSRTVLTSGGLKPVLDEGPDGHSVFAGALLEVLGGNAGVINGEMLHAQVFGRVQMEAARLGYLDQAPQFAAIEDAGHENGQFVLVPRR